MIDQEGGEMPMIKVGVGTRTYARNVYTTGVGGIFEIMEETGKSYEEIRLALSESGVQLVTGGPHDTATCRHDHRLAFEHAAGRCQHPVRARRRTVRQRQLLAVFGDANYDPEKVAHA